MYKAIIIEDDPMLAQTLAKIIKAEAPYFELKGEAPSITGAKKLIDEVRPDVVFCDVELEDGLSFQLLSELEKIDFEIIFVTAFGHYAINAFRYSAIDFVLKPIDPDDIRQASERVLESLGKKNINERMQNFLFNRSQAPTEQKIILQTTTSTHYVPIREIVRCEADINYTRFFLDNGKTIMVSKTMSEFEKMLPAHFFRVHRSHLLNLNYVQEFKKKSNLVVLSNNEKIEISTRKREAFLEALQNLCRVSPG